MANRYFEQFQYSLEKSKVVLFLHATIGAAGAVTIDSAQSKGIASIAHGTAGIYTITLQDTYNKLLGISASVLLASGTPAVVPTPCIKSQAVASTKAIVVTYLDYAGAAADPDSGAELFIVFHLKNSSI